MATTRDSGSFAVVEHCIGLPVVRREPLGRNCRVSIPDELHATSHLIFRQHPRVGEYTLFGGEVLHQEQSFLVTSLGAP